MSSCYSYSSAPFFHNNLRKGRPQGGFFMEKAGNGEKQFQEKLKNSICCNTMKMKLKNSLFSKK